MRLALSSTDLDSRLKGRTQLTSDCCRVYLNVMDETFGPDKDYAMPVKSMDEQNSSCRPCIFDRAAVYERINVGSCKVERIIDIFIRGHVSRQPLQLGLQIRCVSLSAGYAKRWPCLGRAIDTIGEGLWK